MECKTFITTIEKKSFHVQMCLTQIMVQMMKLTMIRKDILNVGDMLLITLLDLACRYTTIQKSSFLHLGELHAINIILNCKYPISVHKTCEVL